MKIGPVYAITDSMLLPGERLFSGVEQALAAGVKTVQLRDKAAATDELKTRAMKLLELCHKYQAQLIINDSVDLAAETGAAGVHLGRSDGSIRAARRRLGKRYIIGATCHDSIPWAQTAVAEGADYVAFGRFYNSSTKPEAGLATIDLLRQAQRELALPIVAIGGINADNARAVFRAGADSVAVCAGIFAADDIHAAAQEMLNTVPTAT